MRVIAGSDKGRRLLAGCDIRPTGDKVKGALFNVLSDSIVGASFLDLYAGSGAVGIEALSRGAANVVFVEQNRKQIPHLQKNLGLDKARDRAGSAVRVLNTSAADFLKRGQVFDFIFVDPPYDGPEIDMILPILAWGDMIAPSGFLIVEHFHKKVLPETVGRLICVKQRKYGQTLLSFYANLT
jgi:16S rRNA (guanine(966)-N(2))-methyltransferase RsmD